MPRCIIGGNFHFYRLAADGSCYRCICAVDSSAGAASAVAVAIAKVAKTTTAAITATLAILLLAGARRKIKRKLAAFAAKVRLEKGDDGKYKINFVFEDNRQAQQTPEELAQSPQVGDCPKCGKVVRDAGNRYVCGECDFAVYRRILQQEITAPQMEKLLKEGATDYLEKFVSKRTGRPFKARLTMDLSAKDGKFSFDFPPRTGKK